MIAGKSGTVRVEQMQQLMCLYHCIAICDGTLVDQKLNIFKGTASHGMHAAAAADT